MDSRLNCISQKRGLAKMWRNSAARGDVSQMSFGFVVPPGGDDWSYERGKSIRTLKKVDLFEISLVGEPAYESTSVALRQALDTVLAGMLADRRRRLAELGI